MSSTVSGWMDDHGYAAYVAYRGVVGGRTPDGKLMPGWDKLPKTIQAAWTMAALASIARHTGEIATKD